MIQEHHIGQQVVFLFGHGHIDSGEIIRCANKNDFIKVQSDHRELSFHREDLFYVDDHEGVTAALDRMIENCETSKSITQRRKLIRKPVVLPPRGESLAKHIG